MKKYAVFVCGPDPMTTNEKVSKRGQDYINLLHNKETEAQEQWIEYKIFQNEFPTTKDIDSLSGICISGSKYDAHDTSIEWIIKLKVLLLDLIVNRKHIRILGICFGSQIIANALKAKTGRNPLIEWECGIRTVDLHKSFFNFFDEREYPKLHEMLSATNKKLKMMQIHQDAVLELPPNATLLANSKNCDIEIYHIGQNVLCTQGHPEWQSDYLIKLFSMPSAEKIWEKELLNETLRVLKSDEADWDILTHMLRKWIRNGKQCLMEISNKECPLEEKKDIGDEDEDEDDDVGGDSNEDNKNNNNEIVKNDKKRGISDMEGENGNNALAPPNAKRRKLNETQVVVQLGKVNC